MQPSRKPKKCRSCKNEYIPSKTLQVVCSPNCAIKYVNSNKEKAANKAKAKQRKEHREAKERIKTRSQWLKEAQTAFNAYIRERDKGLPCISCGRNTGAKVNAGHYLTVGGHPELRFNEDNCHLQCEHCNSYLSGNIARYRPNLIAKIGQGGVDVLEGPHKPLKLTVEQIKEVKTSYRMRAKELNQDS